jgi:hypothetical protein
MPTPTTSPTTAELRRSGLRELIDLMLGSAPDDALHALAAAEHLAQRLADMRRPTALAALQHGASLTDVATAMGEHDTAWITTGLTVWADQELHEGRLGQTEHDLLIAALDVHR